MTPEKWLDIAIKTIIFSKNSDTEKYLSISEVIKSYEAMKEI